MLLHFLAVPGCSALAASAPVVLNPDGAYCWFQDERALVHGQSMTLASITRHGHLQTTTWNFRDGSVFLSDLARDFTADDHNVAGLLLRDDGRLMAFYAQHNAEARMHYRVTRRRGDPRTWGREESFDAGAAGGFTYANPFQMSAERGRLYNFWRGIDFNPTWSASDDRGKTWSKGANHIYYRKGERPYVKYASNGRDTIHFAFTEAHPNRPGLTSLYHALYSRGRLCRSDWSRIRALTDGPITPAEATKVYDGTNPLTGEAWVWDIALDASEKPVIAYTSHPDPQDIRYRYARWNGRAWVDCQVGFAGRHLYRGEEYYAGGICIDPDHPEVLYLSSSVNPQDGSPTTAGRFEIYRATSADEGRTWHFLPLTTNSAVDNLRPIVPAGHPGQTFAVWFRGSYRTYTDFDTELVALTDAKLPPIRKVK
jgi:hypothetical protein